MAVWCRQSTATAVRIRWAIRQVQFFVSKLMNRHQEQHDGITLVEGVVWLLLLASMTIGCAVPERTFGLMFLPTVFFTMLLGTFTGPVRGGLGGVLLLTVAAVVRAELSR